MEDAIFRAMTEIVRGNRVRPLGRSPPTIAIARKGGNDNGTFPPVPAMGVLPLRIFRWRRVKVL